MPTTASPSTRCSSLTCSHSSPALAWRNQTRSPIAQVVGGRAGQRGLHLAGALGAEQLQPGRQPRASAAGSASAGPEAIQPPPSTVASPGAGRRTTGQAKNAAGAGPPGPVRVEQRRPVQPGAGGDLGDRRVGAGRGDAAGAAAVDELQVGVLAYRGHRRRAAGQQLPVRPALHRAGSPRRSSACPGGASPRPAICASYDISPTSRKPGPAGDGGGERAGRRGAVHRRAADADVHPAAQRPPGGVQVEADPQRRAGARGGTTASIRSSCAGVVDHQGDRRRPAPGRRPARPGPPGRRSGTRPATSSLTPARTSQIASGRVKAITPRPAAAGRAPG